MWRERTDFFNPGLSTTDKRLGSYLSKATIEALDFCLARECACATKTAYEHVSSTPEVAQQSMAAAFCLHQNLFAASVRSIALRLTAFC